MNSQQIAIAERLLNRPAASARRALQIRAESDFAEDHFLARIMDVIRSVVLWAVVFAIAASGALLVGNMPELSAAVPNQVRKTPVIAEPAPNTGEVREWYLPDVLSNDDAEAAEPIEAF